MPLTEFPEYEVHCLVFNLPMLGIAESKFYLGFARFVSLLRNLGDLLRRLPM
jgi:hypothetical protein